MEDLVGYNLFNNSYRDKTVIITGHTGFKGSWLALWLKMLGANVVGYSLEPPTNPNHFELIDVDIHSIIGDIRDENYLSEVINQFKPEIIFHLAAQSLVRYSYLEPIETFDTNVLGTLKVLEAARQSKVVKSVIIVTSDKCYENIEQLHGYKEDDRLGGYDPYSASKGCAELLVSSYRNSFLNLNEYTKSHNMLIASVRAGNVIGGGDWAEDRLIPDIIRAVEKNEQVLIRNPQSIRPWQHVLEPLSGYLLLGNKLLNNEAEFAGPWNFGSQLESYTVMEILSSSKKIWDKIDFNLNNNSDEPHEAKMLNLDCTKANTILKWKEIWDVPKSIELTINWYKDYYLHKKINSASDILSYISSAIQEQQSWTKKS